QTHGENAADTFIADDGWKRWAHSVNAPRDQEVALVERRELDLDEDLVRSGSRGRREVDILKTLDRVAIGCELNSAHIDISFVGRLPSACAGDRRRYTGFRNRTT